MVFNYSIACVDKKLGCGSVGKMREYQRKLDESASTGATAAGVTHVIMVEMKATFSIVVQKRSQSEETMKANGWRSIVK